MTALEHLYSLFAQHALDTAGICRIGNLLPLREVRSAGRLPRDCRAVIVCIFPYYVGEYPQRNIARYALPPDYHTVAATILGEICAALTDAHPGEQFVPFVDSSPFREVPAAQVAGLGVIGRHGQLIHPKWGAHAFIGEIATTLELPISQPAQGSCRACGACIRACPTGALSPDKPFELSLCRSHISQKRGELTGWEREQIRDGGFVWGCDLCTDACPMNTRAPSPIRAFYDKIQPVLTPDNLHTSFEHKAYAWRGPKLLERNLLFFLEKEK